MNVKILHNPRCSKSRTALKILQENNIQFDIIEYLKTPLEITELLNISKMLNKKPSEFIRTGEADYKKLKLKNFSGEDMELLEIMSKNPKLIERPIVIKEDKAIIGRPPELVLDLF